MSTGNKRRAKKEKKDKRKAKRGRHGSGPHKFESMQLTFGLPPRKELKSVDVDIIAIPEDNPHLVCLNLIDEGTAFYQRVGRKVSMKSLHLNGWLVPSGQVGASIGDYLRFLVVYDRQSNGVIPPITDILLDQSRSGSIHADPLVGINLVNSERFVILRDIQWGLNDASTGVGYAALDYTQKHTINQFINLKGLEAMFDDPSPSGPNAISTGTLWFVPWGFNLSGQTPWFFRGRSRLRYYDC